MRPVYLIVPALAFLAATSARAQQADSVIAIRPAALIDVERGVRVENPIIIVRNGRIGSVGPDGAIRVPAGARVIDLPSATLLPRLLDSAAIGRPGPRIGAIRAATIDAARRLGVADSVGTIGLGRVADIIGVTGDPLNDAGAMDRVVFVMRRGHVERLPGLQAGEHGAFRIYKLQQRVGDAWYSVRRDSGSLILSDSSKLSYLGGDVQLAATLRMADDYTPSFFAIIGATSTMTGVEALVDISGNTANMRYSGATGQSGVPPRFFTITPYPTPALEEMLFHYYENHGRPPHITMLPAGEARIDQIGRDTVTLATGPVILDRFSVRGIVWGMQIAWFDAAGHLVASVGGDAELDRMEVIREGYESAMPLFVRRSIEDGIAELQRVARIAHPLRTGTYALVGGRVIDGTGRPPIENATVLITNGMITAVGVHSEVSIPYGVPQVQLGGRTILPGLWDMHGHYEQLEWPSVALAAGVTTVRDVGNEFELVTALRDAIAGGSVAGPRMLAAGVIDGGSHPLGVITANTPDEARAAVNRYHAAGFQQIKIYQSIAPALVPVITGEAHRLGMSVTGHVPTGMDAFQFVEAGADQINHFTFITSVMRPPRKAGEPVRDIDVSSPVAQHAIQFFVAHHTVLDPTLARSEEYAHRRGAFVGHEMGIALAPPELAWPLQSTGRDSVSAVLAMQSLDQSLHVVNALRAAGVPIVLGTDLTVPGHSIHRELELAVIGGFTPMQAIQAATIVPARAMGMDSVSGSVEAGKRADLLIVNVDPLEDISNIRKVKYVIANGRMYDPNPFWLSAGFRPPSELERRSP